MTPSHCPACARPLPDQVGRCPACLTDVVPGAPVPFAPAPFAPPGAGQGPPAGGPWAPPPPADLWAAPVRDPWAPVAAAPAPAPALHAPAPGYPPPAYPPAAYPPLAQPPGRGPNLGAPNAGAPLPYQPPYVPQDSGGYRPPAGYAPPGVPPAPAYGGGQPPYGGGYAPYGGPGQAPPGPPGPPGSPYGYPPPFPLGTPPPGFYEPPKVRSGRRLTVVAISICVALVVITGGLIAIGASARDYPDAWDARVMFAVRFVEQQKGGAFEHPVFVEFVPEAEFVDEVSSKGASSSAADDRKQADQQEGLLRALGLVEGDVDLLTERSNLVGSGTAAYYSPTTKHVRVRGTDISLYNKVTLVHELTHAWQDQNYDLTRSKGMDEGAQDSFRALAEGDAVNVERAYLQSLPAGEQADYEKQSTKMSDDAGSGMKTVPPILVASFGAPYELGPYFLQGIQADGGHAAVDAAFASPPQSEDRILEPWEFLTHAKPHPAVSAPAVDAGVTKIEESHFGPLMTYLMLADRVDPHDALAASDAWAGDTYVTTEVDGKVCVKATVSGGDAAGAATLTRVFTAWASELPHLTVTGADTTVTVSGCDPGAGAALHPKGRAMSTIGVPVLRVVLWARFLQDGKTPADAHCLSQAFVAQVTDADLAARPMAKDRVDALKAVAAKAC